MTTKLHLLPTPIVTYGVTNHTSANDEIARAILASDIFFVEHVSRAISFCNYTVDHFNPGEKQWVSIHKQEEQSIKLFIDAAQRGVDIALMSDAGCPCIADPGHQIVAEAHALGIDIIPLVGPSSILLSLMSSGLSAQSFSFNGYLPIDEAKRKKAIHRFQLESKKRKNTQIFIETPYRNQVLFDALMLYLSDDTQLCLAFDILSVHQSIRTKSVAEWKAEGYTIPKVNAVFLFNSSY